MAECMWCGEDHSRNIPECEESKESYRKWKEQKENMMKCNCVTAEHDFCWDDVNTFFNPNCECCKHTRENMDATHYEIDEFEF